MSSAAKGSRGSKTIADWRALPEDARFELIDGTLVEKAPPTFEHGRAQACTVATIGASFHRRPEGLNGPGGWWIGSEIDILLDGQIFRPDILGWRRSRGPVPPRERPLALRPDWICEIVSDSNRSTDTVTKVHRYHQGGVPHYWILDQTDRTLTVFRHTADGYLVAVRAEAHERVHAEPFGEIEILVGALFGDDPDD